MIALDTNVLVRFITQDGGRQAAIATAAIENHSSGEKVLLVTQIVLCELVWVLSKAYNYTKGDLLQLLQRLVSTRELMIEDHEAAVLALSLYADGKADFSDCLIALRGRGLGADATLTFDKAAAKSDLFKQL